jgi:hypothetical protein
LVYAPPSLLLLFLFFSLEAIQHLTNNENFYFLNMLYLKPIPLMLKNASGPQEDWNLESYMEGRLGGSVVEHLPSAQSVIPGSQD